MSKIIIKSVLLFAIFAAVLIIVDLCLFYYHHGEISVTELTNILKPLAITGIIIIPFDMYFRNKK